MQLAARGIFAISGFPSSFGLFIGCYAMLIWRRCAFHARIRRCFARACEIRPSQRCARQPCGKSPKISPDNALAVHEQRLAADADTDYTRCAPTTGAAAPWAANGADKRQHCPCRRCCSGCRRRRDASRGAVDATLRAARPQRSHARRRDVRRPHAGHISDRHRSKRAQRGQADAVAARRQRGQVTRSQHCTQQQTSSHRQRGQGAAGSEQC